MIIDENYKDYLNKLIIVDFDDTLCLYDEKSNGVCDGEPNYELINKLQQAQDCGYNIEIYTARGHFSAEDREDADLKYREIIEHWLEEHKVPYNCLCFNKPYGIIYIDDKAVRPDETDRLDKLLDI